MTLEQVEAHQRRVGKLVAGPELQAQAAILRAKVQLPAERNHGYKFKSIPVDADGQKFGSKKEYRRYLVLKGRESVGEIEGLRCQVKFSLFDPGGACRGEHIGTYTADFVYREHGKLVIEDVKSKATARLRDWPRTKKLLRACHGHEVVEVL